jgi:predicted DNA-binding ribbon-helix-helix protein
MNTPIRDLVTQINSTRKHANLSSNIRLFVLKYYRERVERDRGWP